MRYKIALHESPEGYSVWVPALPGCCSQGPTEGEALANIHEAIQDYLEVIREEWVNYAHAVRALEKAGYRVVRHGKHVVMSDGVRVLTIPRRNPVNADTMGRIVRDAGLTNEEFRRLL